MSIDFGALPPEVNSARMYTGPGSTSLMTAASAWNALAAELNSTARGYQSVITQLSSEAWLGPASAAMAAAVQPYVDWMNATAVQAEEAATQAQSTAAAYFTTFGLYLVAALATFVIRKDARPARATAAISGTRMSHPSVSRVISMSKH